VFGAGLLLLLFTPGLRAQGLLRAIDQLLLFGCRQPGCGMHRKIEPRRHVTLLHFLGDVFGVLLGKVPLSKVQMAAAAVHVSLEQPGHRRDIGIPGKRGLVAMTVKAGPVGQFPGMR
jgi:hypothetical protein